MEDNLKKQYKFRDRTIRVLSRDGKFRAVAIKNLNTVKTSQTRHKLSAIPAYLLAKQLTAASLMASFLKGEERIVLEATGPGPIRRVYAEAMQIGEVRGFAEYSDSIENEKLDKRENYFGKGNYRVSRILYDKGEPIVGIVPLVKGNITAEAANYFQRSEQVDTIVEIEAGQNEGGELIYSGGMLIQKMPGTNKKEFTEMKKSLKHEVFLEALQKEATVEDMLREVIPFEYDILTNRQVDFFCRCSKDKFIAMLVTLGAKEIMEMHASNHDELVCQYCNEHYLLDESDYKKIFMDINSKKN